MKTLLSIDIDYWNYFSDYRQAAALKRYLNKVTQAARQQCAPIHAIMNHQQILPIANASKARRIVNVDTHSDVCEGSVDRLECGSWVNYVEWRNEGEYVWIHRCCRDVGDCSIHGVIFGGSRRPRKKLSQLRHYPRYFKQEYDDVDWKSVKRRRKGAPDPYKLDLSEVVVCLSPSYSDSNLMPIFNEWVKANNIPYRRGRMNERFGINIRPNKIKS
jgi:hypothetical protein